jgi:hypothetical protein
MDRGIQDIHTIHGGSFLMGLLTGSAIVIVAGHRIDPAHA